MKILVAEDDPIFAVTILILIEELGHEALGPAETGEHALRLFHAHCPDLVLLDIGLKGNMDGIGVAEAINQSDFRVPFLFLTAFRDDRNFERAKASEPLAFLMKPFDELTLKRNIDLALQLEKNKQFAAKEAGFISFKQQDVILKIKINQVLFFESDGKDTLVFTENAKYRVRSPMSFFLEQLPAGQFLFPHRSFVVNKEKIKKADLTNSLLFVGEYKLPISKRMKTALSEQLQ